MFRCDPTAFFSSVLITRLSPYSLNHWLPKFIRKLRFPTEDVAFSCPIGVNLLELACGQFATRLPRTRCRARVPFTAKLVPPVF